jgi:hypothetical protein
MTASSAGSGSQATLTLNLTKDEAVAVANMLFMCLRPNNVRPPFEPGLNVQAIESGYVKIGGSISDLEGRRCARCGREWIAPMAPWDSFGDPETGEVELVCDSCITAEEQASIHEHHARLAKYAYKLYSTPAWRGGASGQLRA